MQVVSSRYLLKSKDRLYLFGKYDTRQYERSMIFSWLCYTQPYDIFLIMLHMPFSQEIMLYTIS